MLGDGEGVVRRPEGPVGLELSEAEWQVRPAPRAPRLAKVEAPSQTASGREQFFQFRICLRPILLYQPVDVVAISDCPKGF